MENERYERGLKKLEEVDGSHGMDLVRTLSQKVPDLARYLVEYPFGDIYSRPGLSLRDRELGYCGGTGGFGDTRSRNWKCTSGRLSTWG